MKTVAMILMAAAVVALAGSDIANAASKSRKGVRYCDIYCQRYPSATPRQLQNARAYDRGGEYYEQDPNAHPVGSPGWWYLKQKEGRGLSF